MYSSPEMQSAAVAFDVFAADVFALGIVLFVMLTGDYPWPMHVLLLLVLLFAYVRLSIWNLFIVVVVDVYVEFAFVCSLLYLCVCELVRCCVVYLFSCLYVTVSVNVFVCM